VAAIRTHVSQVDAGNYLTVFGAGQLKDFLEDRRAYRPFVDRYGNQPGYRIYCFELVAAKSRKDR
jgi:hypothetical protein